MFADWEKLPELENNHFRCRDTVSFAGMQEGVGEIAPAVYARIRERVGEFAFSKSSVSENEHPFGFSWESELYIFSPKELRELMMTMYRSGMEAIPALNANGVRFDPTSHLVRDIKL